MMKKINGFIILGIILAACSFRSTSVDEELETRVAGTISAGGTATAAIETGIANALTEVAPPATEVPTDTPIPPPTDIPTETSIPTETPTETPTEIPPSPSPTMTATKKPTPAPCYKVLEDWCLSHLGCATMTVINKTDQPAKLFFKKGDWTASFTIAKGVPPPAARCTMVLRPDRYYYKFEYCGKTVDGYHALNDNWYIQFKCD
jgi:hypothetical protein